MSQVQLQSQGPIAGWSDSDAFMFNLSTFVSPPLPTLQSLYRRYDENTYDSTAQQAKMVEFIQPTNIGTTRTPARNMYF